MIARIRVLLTSVHVEEHKWSVLRELAMASPRWEICSTWSIADGPEASHLSRHVTIRDVHSSDDGAGGMGNVRIRLVPGPEKQSCEITGDDSVLFHGCEIDANAFVDLLALFLVVGALMTYLVRSFNLLVSFD